MLPLPSRRLDPETVRERLRTLAAGRSTARESGVAEVELDAGPDPAADLPVPPRPSLRAVVLAIAATALASWLVVQVTGGGPPSAVQLVPGTPVPSASGVLGASSPPPGAAVDPGPSVAALVVQVLGQVRRPGLVRLPPGSRVADAVAAAGGLVPGGSSGGLNLARLVSDGEQIVVSPSAAAAPVSGGASGVTTSVVDLNTATATDLDALPGVGPVTAAHILDWRTAHGRFATVAQLREVPGIGAVTFERLKPHVRV